MDFCITYIHRFDVDYKLWFLQYNTNTLTFRLRYMIIWMTGTDFPVELDLYSIL